AESMLAIEKARKKEPTEPAKFTLARRNLNDGPKGRRLAARRSDRDLKTRTLNGLALGGDNERIPVRVGAEVGQDRPDAPRRRIDIDGGFDLSHCVVENSARYSNAIGVPKFSASCDAFRNGAVTFSCARRR